jgi:hypothetical protein
MPPSTSRAGGSLPKNAAAKRVFTKLYVADKPPKSRAFTFGVMGDNV